MADIRFTTSAIPFESLQEILKEKYTLTDDELNEALSAANTTLQSVFTFKGNDAEIYRRYPASAKEQYSQADMNFIVHSTNIWLPAELVFELVSVMRAKAKRQATAFAPPQSLSVMRDESVALLLSTSRKGKELRLQHSMNDKNATIETKPVVRVFLWSRALNGVSGDDCLINLSPFLMTGSTHVDKNGGSWNLSLDPVTALGEAGAWDFATVVGNIAKRAGLDGMEYTSDSHTHKQEFRPIANKITPLSANDAAGVNRANAGEYTIIDDYESISRRNTHLFSAIISPQDIIFIKFDPLESEDREGYRAQDMIDPFVMVSLSDFRGDYWDMMGLVDEVDENGRVSDADISIDVTGRDLMKLVIEDGTYFFPVTTGDGFQTNYFANAPTGNSDSRAYQRLLGEAQELTLWLSKPIKGLMEFIYKKLSVVEVVPDTVFEGYPQANPDGFGIWKLTQLVIDDEVGRRILYDHGLRTAQGTMLSFFQSICLDPFAEFYGETYGEKYAFIVRRPPFLKEDIDAVYEASGRITLTENEIEHMSLTMNDTEAYSWYRLNPEAFMFGDSDMATFYFPAIYLDAYARIFGARKMEYVSKYLDYGDNGNGGEFGYQVALNDLRYIVQTHALLPFTRHGTITTRNTRRIKRGTWILIEGTDEVAYVDAVTNSFSINMGAVDCDTVLSVSRVMKRAHLSKYFELVNMPDPTTSISEARKVSWAVNESVFNFFVEKKQFL